LESNYIIQEQVSFGKDKQNVNSSPAGKVKDKAVMLFDKHTPAFHKLPFRSPDACNVNARLYERLHANRLFRIKNLGREYDFA
jgi:hypothetical protein